MNKNYFILKNSWILLLLLISSFAFGQKTWNGSSSNNWNTGANWTLSGVPAPTDDVVIPNVSTDDPRYNVLSSTIKSLTINNGGKLEFDRGGVYSLNVTGGVTINSGGSFTIRNGGGTNATSSLYVGGNFSNAEKIDFTSNSVMDLYFNVTNQTVSGSGGYDLNRVFASNTGNLTVTSSIASAVDFTVNSGSTLVLGATNIIPTSPIILNGGTFSTGASAGFTETVGTLGLTDDSGIKLGTGNNTMTFGASNGVSWTSGKILTITGWVGGYNGTAASGANPKIFIGTANTHLTPSQLSQIRFFDGTNYYNAILRSNGELVPTNTTRINTFPSSACVGSTIIITGLGFTGTTGASAVKVNGVNVASYIVISNTSITATLTATQTSGIITIVSPQGTANSTSSLIVNPIPTSVTATPSVTAICAGGSLDLTASAISNTLVAVTLINENFNSTPIGWTTKNNSTGGTPANAAWTLRVNNYNNGTSYGQTLNSNDATQFYLSDSDAQGNGSTTATILQSPSFSTVGLSSVSLSFYHYYRYNGTESANVQVSTNGTAWVNLNTYSGTQGARNGFALATFDLAAYLGQATVYIRFKYDATWDYYWAIDNVSVTGVSNNGPATYAWTSTPAGFTSSEQNPTGVAPTVNTTYTVTVTNASGCTSSATTAEVIVNASTTWNGSAWSNGDPNSTKKIIFEGNYPPAVDPNVDLVGCSCEVNLGAVIIKEGRTLTLTNELKVTGGSLTFDNNASLVQTSTTATNNNTGKIYYKRHTTPVRRYDYTYWSSPVQPQTMIALSPNTLSDKFWSFDSDANDWVLSDGGGATMQPANGYSIRAPQTFDIVTAAIDTAPMFFGVPNNGNYSFPSTATSVEYKSYLLGNPYPSALDAVTFLGANSGVLDGTLYFWTHNSNVTPIGAFYEYSDNDYATFNLTGGTGTAAALNTGVNNSIPSGKIAAGQGFFATGIATGPINFTNAMRVGVGSITGNNSQFFRTSKTKAKTTTAIEKNRVWLNLYNDQGAFKQALIGYVTGATNEYDNGYDGESFDGNKYVDFYSVTPENYLVIQGRALPFDETDTVPLGYRALEDMNLNISIDQTDGLLATQNVFIEDKLLNVIHNIKDTPYAFTTQAGTFDDRFVLRYTDKTLGTGDFNLLSNQIIISKDKNELKIKSELETIKRVTVFDLLGRKVFEKDTEDSNEFRSSSVGLSKQIGVVKVTLTNGKVISKKVRF